MNNSTDIKIVKSKKAILLIGDAPIVAEELASLLTEQGYSLKTTTFLASPTDLTSTLPDLIFLTATSHHYDLCRRLQTDSAYASIPVIFVSDSPENLDKSELFAAGGVDYLAQPFCAAEVIARVENQLRHRHVEQELQKSHNSLEQRVAERTSALSQTVTLLEEQVKERQLAEAALQKYAHLQGVLRQIDQAILAAQSSEAIAQAALGHIRYLIPCVWASMTLFDFELNEATPLAVSKDSLTEINLKSSWPLDAFGDLTDLHDGHPIVEDISSSDEILSQTDRQLLAEGMQSRILAPLISREKLIGCLTLAAKTPGVFNVEHVAIAHEVATQLAVALENARLQTETQQRALQLSALNKANRAMASTLNLDVVLEQVMTEVKTLLNAEGASVLLHDPINDELFFSTVVAPEADTLAGVRLPLTEGIAGWVMQERQAVMVDNVQQDSRFYDRIDDVTGLTTQSLLAVPLTYKDRAIGVVEVINKAGERFKHQDLDLLEALTSSAAIAIENARLYRDLQDRMKALQETQTQLIQSEKMAALGRLVASITHEINNPLQSVQTCLTLTREEFNDGRRQAKIEQYLDIVESEIQRVSTIVRRMRDFYRPAANQGLQRVNLRKLLENVLALTGKQLQNSQIVIEGVWSKSLPQIQANADHLQQVFLNLILNAIDAMPDGGTLYISTRRDKIQRNEYQPAVPAVRVEFRDTGQGMTVETLTHLFEPFFTTKPHGSGLGLCISYNIVEAHHGHIIVASEISQGTNFTILLPLEQPEETLGDEF